MSDNNAPVMVDETRTTLPRGNNTGLKYMAEGKEFWYQLCVLYEANRKSKYGDRMSTFLNHEDSGPQVKNENKYRMKMSRSYKQYKAGTLTSGMGHKKRSCNRKHVDIEEALSRELDVHRMFEGGAKPRRADVRKMAMGIAKKLGKEESFKASPAWLDSVLERKMNQSSSTCPSELDDEYSDVGNREDIGLESTSRGLDSSINPASVKLNVAEPYDVSMMIKDPDPTLLFPNKDREARIGEVTNDSNTNFDVEQQVDQSRQTAIEKDALSGTWFNPDAISDLLGLDAVLTNGSDGLLLETVMIPDTPPPPPPLTEDEEQIVRELRSVVWGRELRSAVWGGSARSKAREIRRNPFSKLQTKEKKTETFEDGPSTKRSAYQSGDAARRLIRPFQRFVPPKAPAGLPKQSFSATPSHRDNTTTEPPSSINTALADRVLDEGDDYDTISSDFRRARIIRRRVSDSTNNMRDQRTNQHQPSEMCLPNLLQPTCHAPPDQEEDETKNANIHESRKTRSATYQRKRNNGGNLAPNSYVAPGTVHVAGWTDSGKEKQSRSERGRALQEKRGASASRDQDVQLELVPKSNKMGVSFAQMSPDTTFPETISLRRIDVETAKQDERLEELQHRNTIDDLQGARRFRRTQHVSVEMPEQLPDLSPTTTLESEDGRRFQGEPRRHTVDSNFASMEKMPSKMPLRSRTGESQLEQGSGEIKVGALPGQLRTGRGRPRIPRSKYDSWGDEGPSGAPPISHVQHFRGEFQRQQEEGFQASMEDGVPGAWRLDVGEAVLYHTCSHVELLEEDEVEPKQRRWSYRLLAFALLLIVAIFVVVTFVVSRKNGSPPTELQESPTEEWMSPSSSPSEDPLL